MRRLSFLVLLTLTAAPPAVLVAQTGAATTQAAATIAAADVARHIRVIADDSMMGRATPSRGVELTAQYIADQFKKFGLVPGGDSGSWFQRYPIPNDETTTAPNVIGIIQGSDPKLRDEYVVYTAHMDHIGISSGQVPDSINNGADDNGSGTVAILELAEAFSRQGARPRRSVMLVTFSGEEEMGWGSRYFIAHPPRPLSQLVAEVNLDMIGRNAVDSVEVLGKADSDLGPVVDQAAAAHPELHLFPAVGGSAFTFDSDHYFFAKAGVPTIFFHSGLHADYHGVGDSPEKLDTDKVARVARLAFYVGQLVGSADPRPAWNAQGRKQLEEEQKYSQEDRLRDMLQGRGP